MAVAAEVTSGGPWQTATCSPWSRPKCSRCARGRNTQRRARRRQPPLAVFSPSSPRGLLLLRVHCARRAGCAAFISVAALPQSSFAVPFSCNPPPALPSQRRRNLLFPAPSKFLFFFMRNATTPLPHDTTNDSSGGSATSPRTCRSSTCISSRSRSWADTRRERAAGPGLLPLQNRPPAERPRRRQPAAAPSSPPLPRRLLSGLCQLSSAANLSTNFFDRRRHPPPNPQVEINPDILPGSSSSNASAAKAYLDSDSDLRCLGWETPSAVEAGAIKDVVTILPAMGPRGESLPFDAAYKPACAPGVLVAAKLESTAAGAFAMRSQRRARRPPALLALSSRPAAVLQP